MHGRLPRILSGLETRDHQSEFCSSLASGIFWPILQLLDGSYWGTLSVGNTTLISCDGSGNCLIQFFHVNFLALNLNEEGIVWKL